LNGIVELLVELSLLGWSILRSNFDVSVIFWDFGGLVDALDSGISLEILGDLLLNLREVLGDISVALLELLLSELSYLSSHHALLVLEKAVRSTEEAVKADNFLEESELGVGTLVLGRLDGLLNGGVDLVVNLLGGESGYARVKGGGFSRLGESSLDETSNLLNMSLSIDLSGFDTGLLLNSIYQTNWDAFLGKV